MNISNASLIKSDVIPVLNILEILTTLEEYTIAIDGVVEGIALEMPHATLIGQMMSSNEKQQLHDAPPSEKHSSSQDVLA
jgi:hypothetical protein